MGRTYTNMGRTDYLWLLYARLAEIIIVNQSSSNQVILGYILVMFYGLEPGKIIQLQNLSSTIFLIKLAPCDSQKDNIL